MKIIIYGEPVAQSRPRFARTKYGVRTYTDSKVADYREQVQFQALNQYKDEPMTGALRVDITIYRYLPKSGSKALKLRRLNGDDRPTVKPDIDNYFKAVTDAVKGILWVDDNQIVESFISKYYSDDPRVELEITQI